MAFCARFRFRILPALEIPEGESSTITIPGLPPATLESNQNAWPFGQWAVLKLNGFGTETEAWRAGQRLGDTLLVAGAVTKLGIDIGFSRSTLQFSEEVHRAVQAETGKELRTDTHGLMVYEEDTLAIVGLNAHGSSLLGPDTFEQRLADWMGTTSRLTERQRNCAALLNDSFFVPQTEGQFILRVSAVEALCNPMDVGAGYQAAIGTLETFVASQSLAPDIRETISRFLTHQKKQSLRQSYMTKFRTLLSDADARAFDALYQKRSKLVHEGRGRGGLAEAANEAMDLATTLLAADLQPDNGTES